MTLQFTHQNKMFEIKISNIKVTPNGYTLPPTISYDVNSISIDGEGVKDFKLDQDLKKVIKSLVKNEI